MYMEPSFAVRAHHILIGDRHHAVGVSPGIDLAVVARHVVAALARVTQRQLVHAVILVATVIIEVVWMRNSHPRGTFNVFDPPIILGALCAFFVTLQDLWSLRYGEVAAQLRRDTFDPDPLHGKYGHASNRIEELAALQEGNVVIYSGFSPFVGSGLDLGGWSFTVDIEKGKEYPDGSRAHVEPFEVRELYAFLDERLKALEIQGLNARDLAFVNGCDIRGDERFLRDPFQPPKTRLSPALLQACVDAPTPQVRHYKCVRITDWDNELVLSALFRIAKRRRTLFAEACFFLLTPVKESYRVIDNRPVDPALRHVVEMVITSATIALFQCAFSPLALLGKMQQRFEESKKEREQRKAIEDQTQYDFGAATTVRELATSGSYRRYFQKLDKEMYAKLTQRTVLDGLCDFLEQHGIETSDLRDRQATIYNSGVMVSGGTVNAENMTVGARARSVVRNVANTPAKH
jgi:hypothetical protein